MGLGWEDGAHKVGSTRASTRDLTLRRAAQNSVNVTINGHVALIIAIIHEKHRKHIMYNSGTART